MFTYVEEAFASYLDKKFKNIILSEFDELGTVLSDDASMDELIWEMTFFDEAIDMEKVSGPVRQSMQQAQKVRNVKSELLSRAREQYQRQSTTARTKASNMRDDLKRKLSNIQNPQTKGNLRLDVAKKIDATKHNVRTRYDKMKIKAFEKHQKIKQQKMHEFAQDKSLHDMIVEDNIASLKKTFQLGK